MIGAPCVVSAEDAVLCASAVLAPVFQRMLLPIVALLCVLCMKCSYSWAHALDVLAGRRLSLLLELLYPFDV